MSCFLLLFFTSALQYDSTFTWIWLVMAGWRGPTRTNLLYHTLMCALALLSSPSVVCRLQSGPRGMSDFNLSKHRRRCARLWKEKSRFTQTGMTGNWKPAFFRLMDSFPHHWSQLNQIIIFSSSVVRTQDKTGHKAIWLPQIDFN